MSTVYLLRDPRDQAPRYVGYTRHPVAKLYRRVHGHGVASAQDSTLPVHVWLGHLVASGLWPVVEVLETVPRGDPGRREVHWIRYYARESRGLLNVARNPRLAGRWTGDMVDPWREARVRELDAVREQWATRHQTDDHNKNGRTDP